jgi:hypothetical protein
MQDHAAIGSLDSGGVEPLCPNAESAANCLGHCIQSDTSDEQSLPLNVPAVAVAPLLALHRVWLPVGLRPLVIASAPPIVGPRLTILFHNFRN